eukprot:jgi/Hompol1/5843/HPOL_000795-RA
MLGHYNKYLPFVNFVIATTALSFQMFVLYPWHHQLDADFHELKSFHEQKLADYHQKKIAKLDEIEQLLQAKSSKVGV